MAVDVGAALALLGLAFAWLLYRLERSASRQREIDAAQATLRAVKQGMLGDEHHRGWGEHVFSTVYDDSTALARAHEDADAVGKELFLQVFVTPTEPLRLLASSAGEHISTETLRAANVALWQVEIFNQLVEGQQAWHVRYAVEIIDKATTPERRALLANGAATFSFLLHGQIGGANHEGGWYRLLKDAVDADISRLDRERRRARWTQREWWLALGDCVAVLAAVAAVVGITLAVADAFEDERQPVELSSWEEVYRTPIGS